MPPTTRASSELQVIQDSMEKLIELSRDPAYLSDYLPLPALDPASTIEQYHFRSDARTEEGILHLSQRIDHISRLLEGLDYFKTALTHRHGQAQNYSAPISILPDEILGDIFEYSRGSSSRALVITHVCHRWRQVAIGQCTLWDCFDFLWPLAKIEAWATRAKQLTMHVTISPPNPHLLSGPSIDLLDYILSRSSHLSRASTLIVSLEETHSRFFEEIIRHTKLSALHHMDVSSPSDQDSLTITDSMLPPTLRSLSLFITRLRGTDFSRCTFLRELSLEHVTCYRSSWKSLFRSLSHLELLLLNDVEVWEDGSRSDTSPICLGALDVLQIIHVSFHILRFLRSPEVTPNISVLRFMLGDSLETSNVDDWIQSRPHLSFIAIESKHNFRDSREIHILRSGLRALHSGAPSLCELLFLVEHTFPVEELKELVLQRANSPHVSPLKSLTLSSCPVQEVEWFKERVGEFRVVR